MQSNVIPFPRAHPVAKSRHEAQRVQKQYSEAEAFFSKLIEIDELDDALAKQPTLAESFEKALNLALLAAYERQPACPAAQKLLHRVLFKINSLKHFWYDSLQLYDNERSFYLQKTAILIEQLWQQHELAQVDVSKLFERDFKTALLARLNSGLKHSCWPEFKYIENDLGEAGYKRLAASLVCLENIKAGQLSRAIAGKQNLAQSILLKLMTRTNDSFRAQANGNQISHEAHFSSYGLGQDFREFAHELPWETLALVNHGFLLSERKRFFLRFIGSVLYNEITLPELYMSLLNSARRLELNFDLTGFWQTQIKESKKLQRWVFEGVVLPLSQTYNQESWEILLGYDQQHILTCRSLVSLTRDARHADAHAALFGHGA